MDKMTTEQLSAFNQNRKWEDDIQDHFAAHLAENPNLDMLELISLVCKTDGQMFDIEVSEDSPVGLMFYAAFCVAEKMAQKRVQASFGISAEQAIEACDLMENPVTKPTFAASLLES